MIVKSMTIRAFACAALLLSASCAGNNESKEDRARRVSYDDCRVMMDSVFKKSFIIESRVVKFCSCMTIDLNKSLTVDHSEMTKAIFKRASETNDLSAAILSESPLNDTETQTLKETIEQTFQVCEGKLQK